MFKNALVYHIDQWQPPTQAEIAQRLERLRFVECAPSQPESTGWTEPRGQNGGALLESVGGQLILQLCAEHKVVPASVVRQQLEARLDRVESASGRRPRGKARRELKDQLVHELLPRAFAKRSSTVVWIDLAAQRVLIGAGSAKKADGVITRLVELFGGLRLAPLQTELSPATAMSAWLSDKEAPPGFSIDRECVLQQPDSERSAVRYARHTLDIDEVGEHIRQGKLPTQLALTWRGRVSFVLTETLALKKIKLLDGVLEQTVGGATEDDFDANVALITGELGGLLPDLIEALGGPQAPPES